MKKLTKKQNIELAAQLRKPTGASGLEVAEVMNETNGAMISNTLDALNLLDNDKVLELGHGNGKHILDLLKSASGLHYQGLDISELMKAEAEKYCAVNNLTKQTNFKLYDGKKVPFEENSFHKIFSINTLYFWEEPTELLKELYRVLKPNGICCVTFITKKAMDGLEFTDYGFEKYTKEKFEGLVKTTDFKLLNLKMESESITGKLGDLTNRVYYMGVLTNTVLTL